MESVFIEMLKGEYLKRQSKNPGYSLRAFAKSLGIHQSHMSRVLNGQRTLSPLRIRELALRLKWDDVDLVKVALETELSKRTARYKKLIEEELQAVNRWYYFALLELPKTKGFQSDFAWAARRLGLSKTTVKLAVEKLVQLGHLKIDESGQWQVQTMASDWTSFRSSSVVRREIQKDIISKALEAMDTIPFEKREQASLTIAGSAKEIELIKIKIQEFRETLRESCSVSKTKDQVYQLSISFFPLTHETKV